MAIIETSVHSPKNSGVFLARVRVLQLTEVTLWTLLVLMYLLSGVLTLLSDQKYRMGLMSLLVLPLLFLRPLRVNRVFLAFAVLVGVVLTSGIVNASPPGKIIEFLRIPLFAFLLYYLTFIAVDEHNIRHILRFFVIVAIVQLPIILLQWWSFDYLPDSFKENVGILDFGFGTFNFKTDYSMSFLLTLLTAWLILDPRRSSWVRARGLLAIWYSLTVFIAAAQIMKIGVILVWLIYGMQQIGRLRLRTLLIISSSLLALYFGTVALYEAELLPEYPTQFINRIEAGMNDLNADGYLQGNYDRFGALQYLLFSGTTPLLGDGPAAYSDAFTRELVRGNTGHFFTFFSEIGPIGWAASVLVFFLIAFPIQQGKLRVALTPVLFFMLINLLAFTSSIMNDIAVVTSFCIMVRAATMSVGKIHE